MEFRTIIDIPDPGFRISPCEEMLFVGSCFATEIGRRFQEDKFRAVVNPYGVMYNPASILHTIQQWEAPCEVAFLTLGTNHVYRLKETGEIVDNCQKRPQSLFVEEELSVEACAYFLQQAIDILRQRNPRLISPPTRSYATSCAITDSIRTICSIPRIRLWIISGNDSPRCGSAMRPRPS